MESAQKNASYSVVQIGCGVVGGAYAKAYKSIGCKVIGIDASMNAINKLKDDIKMYYYKDDVSDIKNIDFIMISVWTPLNTKTGCLDLSYLFDTVPNVATMIKNSPDAFVVIRSTVRPLTTNIYREKLIKALDNTNIKPKVLFQPEFLRDATALEDALKPWKIVVGVPKDVDASKLLDLYLKFLNNDKSRIKILNVVEAELQKLFHNDFNATKISYFNQCALLCEAISKEHNVELNMNEISSTMTETCEGLLNPKYGTMTKHAYYGTCLPKDSQEFADLENLYKLPAKLMNAVVDVNNEIKKTDQKVVLKGDFHMSREKFFAATASNSLSEISNSSISESKSESAIASIKDAISSAN